MNEEKRYNVTRKSAKKLKAKHIINWLKENKKEQIRKNNELFKEAKRLKKIGM